MIGHLSYVGPLQWCAWWQLLWRPWSDGRQAVKDRRLHGNSFLRPEGGEKQAKKSIARFVPRAFFKTPDEVSSFNRPIRDLLLDENANCWIVLEIPAGLGWATSCMSGFVRLQAAQKYEIRLTRPKLAIAAVIDRLWSNGALHSKSRKNTSKRVQDRNQLR